MYEVFQLVVRGGRRGGGSEILLGGVVLLYGGNLRSDFDHSNIFKVKGALPGLRQFLAAESLLKMIQSAFYFMSAVLVLKIFKFLFWIFGHAAKRLDKKDKFNFKFYDITAWLTNN